MSILYFARFLILGRVDGCCRRRDDTDIQLLALRSKHTGHTEKIRPHEINKKFGSSDETVCTCASLLSVQSYAVNNWATNVRCAYSLGS